MTTIKQKKQKSNSKQNCRSKSGHLRPHPRANADGKFQVPRRLLDHDIFTRPLELRLYLLLLANAIFRDDGLEHGGRQLKQGQYIRSLSRLAVDLAAVEDKTTAGRSTVIEISRSRLRRAIDYLNRHTLIETEKTGKGLLFTVCEYSAIKDFSKSTHFERENRHTLSAEIDTLLESENSEHDSRIAKPKSENRHTFSAEIDTLLVPKLAPEELRLFLKNKGIKRTKEQDAGSAGLLLCFLNTFTAGERKVILEDLNEFKAGRWLNLLDNLVGAYRLEDLKRAIEYGRNSEKYRRRFDGLDFLIQRPAGGPKDQFVEILIRESYKANKATAAERKKNKAERRTLPAGSEPPEFAEFWQLYPAGPNKGKKAMALKIWHGKAKVHPGGGPGLLADIKDVLESWQLSDWADVEPEFIPGPASYLAGERWEDEQGGAEYEEEPAAPPPPPAHLRIGENNTPQLEEVFTYPDDLNRIRYKIEDGRNNYDMPGVRHNQKAGFMAAVKLHMAEYHRLLREYTPPSDDDWGNLYDYYSAVEAWTASRSKQAKKDNATREARKKTTPPAAAKPDALESWQ